MLFTFLAAAAIGIAPPGEPTLSQDELKRRDEILKSAEGLPQPRLVIDDNGTEPRDKIEWKNKVGDTKVYRIRCEPRHVVGNEFLKKFLGDNYDTDAQECEFAALVTAIEPDGTVVVAVTVLKVPADEKVGSDDDKKSLACFAGIKRGQSNVIRLTPPGTIQITKESSLDDLSGHKPLQLWTMIEPGCLPTESVGAGAKWHIESKMPSLSFMRMDFEWEGGLLHSTGDYLQSWTQVTMRSVSFAPNAGGATEASKPMLNTMLLSTTTRRKPGDALPEWTALDMVMTTSHDLFDQYRDAPAGLPERTFVSYTLSVIPPEMTPQKQTAKAPR